MRDERTTALKTRTMVALALRTTTMVQTGTCPRAREPRRFSSRASLSRLWRSAQQLADSCCCIQVIAASSAMGEETRSRTRAGKHATLGWFSPPHFSRDVARCGHPLRLRCRRSVSLSRVVSSVAAPCGASERRACIATGDTRATRALGGSRRRSRAGPFAHAAVVSSSLALRPSGRLSSFSSRVFSTAAAPRGARARGATGDKRATRAARVRRRGWFSPPQSSRAVRTRRGGLFFSCSSPVPSVAPRARLRAAVTHTNLYCSYTADLAP